MCIVTFLILLFVVVFFHATAPLQNFFSLLLLSSEHNPFVPLFLSLGSVCDSKQTFRDWFDLIFTARTEQNGFVVVVVRILGKSLSKFYFLGNKNELSLFSAATVEVVRCWL